MPSQTWPLPWPLCSLLVILLCGGYYDLVNALRSPFVAIMTMIIARRDRSATDVTCIRANVLPTNDLTL